MGAELGVTTSVFPSDEITKEFLDAQGRGDQWRELIPDGDAEYDRTIMINLSELEPMVACPHSPDNIKTIEELKGMKVDQVAIGSCTNASYKDLMTVAAILKGKKVSPEVSLVVAPGSKQVFEMIAANGALTDLISAGARIMESACGFCIGSGQAPVTKGISLRTNNRNFEGRSGTQSGQIYLASPETAALSALTGTLVNPLDQAAGDYPDVAMPTEFLIDDSMVLPPSDKKIEIFRGPNIGDPPYTEPLMDEIRGVIGLKVGDKITTDHIMPAGQRLKYRSNIPAYSQYVFEGVDAEFAGKTLSNREKGIFTGIVGGMSYGQGSSREHAAICPMYLGVRLVMVKSFERIHSGNLVNFGIIPLLFKDESDYDGIELGQEMVATDLRRLVAESDLIPVTIGGKEYQFDLFASERQRKILLDGGLLNYTRKQA